MSEKAERMTYAEIRDRNLRRSLVLNVETPAMRGDCLGILLASEFESHPDCPEDGELDDTDTWKQWAIDRVNEIADEVYARVAESLTKQQKR
jgi:hypothetical protein